MKVACVFRALESFGCGGGGAGDWLEGRRRRVKFRSGPLRCRKRASAAGSQQQWRAREQRGLGRILHETLGSGRRCRCGGRAGKGRCNMDTRRYQCCRCRRRKQTDRGPLVSFYSSLTRSMPLMTTPDWPLSPFHHNQMRQGSMEMNGKIIPELAAPFVASSRPPTHDGGGERLQHVASNGPANCSPVRGCLYSHHPGGDVESDALVFVDRVIFMVVIT